MVSRSDLASSTLSQAPSSVRQRTSMNSSSYPTNSSLQSDGRHTFSAACPPGGTPSRTIGWTIGRKTRARRPMNDRDANAFQTTRWTQVIAARGSSPQARRALGELCDAYYAPVAAFVQHYRSGRDDFRDLTHEFFATLLEGNSLGHVEPTRGRFRS